MHRILRGPALGLALDPCLVLAFVVIGRAGHHAGGGLAGLAGTAWPFLAGTAAGEVLTRGWRRPTALIPVGIGVWLSTVGIGMALRVVAGQGTAAAFVVVAFAFLGLLLLGWRLLATLLKRAAAPAGPAS